MQYCCNFNIDQSNVAPEEKFMVYIVQAGTPLRCSTVQKEKKKLTEVVMVGTCEMQSGKTWIGIREGEDHFVLCLFSIVEHSLCFRAIL